MPTIGGTEVLLILLVVLLLFGAKRLPDLSRSLGRSLRIIKSDTKALHDDTATSDTGVDADAGVRSADRASAA